MESTHLQSSAPASNNASTVLNEHNIESIPEPNTSNEFLHYQHPSAEESAQSRVLRNHELLELIMTHLQGMYKLWDSSDKREMVAVSLTCKNFLDPTLNIVWRSVVSWPSILDLIPSVERFDQDDGPTYVTTTRALTPEDLERLDSYVRRIRHFRVVASTEEISPHIFAYISKLRHFQLFPALTTLSIPYIETIMDRDIPALYLTPSPTLSVVKINNILTTQSQIYAASLLHDISDRCPMVTSLTLGGAVDGMVLNALKGFNRLETLQVLIVDVDLALSAFPPLPNLKYFKIIMDHSSRWIFSNPAGHIPLDSLETLEITGSPKHVNLFLRNASLSSITHVSMCFTHTERDSSPDMCLGTLLKKDGVKRTLRSIKMLSGVDLYIPITGDTLLHRSGMMPPHLECLELELGNMSKKSLCSILTTLECRAQIKHLKLVNRNMNPQGDNNGDNENENLPYEVSELDIIASSFPNLVTATIPVSPGMATGSQVQKMRDKVITTEQAAHHGLERLTLVPIVPSSRRDEAQTVYNDAVMTATSFSAYFLARYIDHMFPQLKALNLGSGVLLIGDKDNCCKSMILKFIKEFQDERKTKNQRTSSDHGPSRNF